MAPGRRLSGGTVARDHRVLMRVPGERRRERRERAVVEIREDTEPARGERDLIEAGAVAANQPVSGGQ